MTKPTIWLCAQRRLRSAWAADAQADLSLHWAHSHFVGFVMSWLISRSIETDLLLQYTCTLSSVQILSTVKILSIRTPQKFCCNHPKIWTRWLHQRVMRPKTAAGIANSVDLDQTAPLGAVWSGSALFSQTYLSKNFGSLRYICNAK